MLVGIWLPALIVLFVVFAGLMVLMTCLVLRRIRSSNAALKSMTQLADEKVARLRALVPMCENPGLAQQIEKVSADLYFSDSSIVLPLDARISELVDSLYEVVRANDERSTSDELNELSALVAQRRAELSCIKRGSF